MAKYVPIKAIRLRKERGNATATVAVIVIIVTAVHVGFKPPFKCIDDIIHYFLLFVKWCLIFLYNLSIALQIQVRFIVLLSIYHDILYYLKHYILSHRIDKIQLLQRRISADLLANRHYLLSQFV